MSVREPPLHLIPQEDGKLRVCLSTLAKWIGGIAATLIGSILIGAFIFAWQSNAVLSSISAKLDAIDRQLDSFDRRLDRHDERLEKIDSKLDTKEDKHAN